MVQPFPTPPPPSAGGGSVWAGVAVLGLLVVGLVTAGVAHAETAATACAVALAAAVPVVLGLFKIDRIEQHVTTTAEAVRQVEQKVNGELRQEVMAAAHAAGREAVVNTADEIRAAVKEAAVEETKRAIRGPSAGQHARSGDAPTHPHTRSTDK